MIREEMNRLMNQVEKTLGLKEENDPHFKPSPAKKINFPNGKVMRLNRRERRANKIWNKDLRLVKR